MVMPFRNKLYDCCNKWLSFDKCFKTLKRYASNLRQSITGNSDDIEEFVRKIYYGFVIGHWLEKKKNKLGFEEIMSYKFDN